LKAFLRAARPRTFDHVSQLMATALGLFMPDECMHLRQALRLSCYYMKVEHALMLPLVTILLDRKAHQPGASSAHGRGLSRTRTLSYSQYLAKNPTCDAAS
jgi:hypothetical protein